VNSHWRNSQNEEGGKKDLPSEIRVGGEKKKLLLAGERSYNGGFVYVGKGETMPKRIPLQERSRRGGQGGDAETKKLFVWLKRRGKKKREIHFCCVGKIRNKSSRWVVNGRGVCASCKEIRGEKERIRLKLLGEEGACAVAGRNVFAGRSIIAQRGGK